MADYGAAGNFVCQCFQSDNIPGSSDPQGEFSFFHVVYFFHILCAD